MTGRARRALVASVGTAVVAWWVGPGVSPRAVAQSGGPEASPPVARAVTPAVDRPPALLARVGDEGSSRPLGIERVRVETVIAGFLARTTTTITFRNDHDRVLEGEMVFPLPEGATVSGYGLDVEGEMVDGVVVEQRAARVAFEKEVRRGVDPGLVEWVQGANFRTRVWPIPARGTRTVKVEYVSDLVTERRDEALAALYHLPLRFPAPVGAFELRVEVVKGTAVPEIRGGSLANFRFAAWEDRFVAETRLANATLADDLRIALPRLPRQNVVVERDEDGRYYFVIDDFAPPPPAPAAPPARPGRVGLLWDASLSRAGSDAAREIGLLEAWLARLGDVDVDLTIFRDLPEARRRIAIRKGNADALVALLEQAPKDGATNLGALDLEGDVAYYVLVSDGLSTLGSALPRRLPAPVYALCGDAQADHALLRHLAQTSGGAYFNLARATDEMVLSRLGLAGFALTGVDYDPASVTAVLPEGVVPVLGRATVSGRLLAPEARVTLRFGGGGAAAQARSYTLRQADAHASGLVSRFWAQQRVAELSVFAEKNRDEITDLGRKFGIVTPGTSLLVLERLEQYLEHGIAPPKTRPAMRAEWERLIEERASQAAKARADKLERVADMWRRRVEWWTHEFKYEPPKPVTPASRDRRPPRLTRQQPCPAGRASLVGTVSDPTGSAVPGATVSVVQEGQDQGIAVESDALGAYQVCGLSPGRYVLHADMPGFRTFRRSVVLQSPTGRTVDIRLDVGAVSETIEIADADDEGVASGVEGGVAGGMAEGFVGGAVAGVVVPPAPPPPAPAMALAGERQDVVTAAANAVPDTRSGESNQATIAIRAWDPETPYLDAMKEAGPARAYAVYLEQRPRYADSPAFYLDCADHLLRAGQRDLGLRVLTSVVELKLEDARLTRVAAHRLQQIGELDLAIGLFEKVLRLRPEEPQSPRDLALALAARGDERRARSSAPQAIADDYLRALDLLDQVVLGDWDGRFPDIEVVALMDANRLLALMEREKLPGVATVKLDARLRKLLDVDVRIVLTWDADATDMDLWVIEPTGEKCFYSNALTAIGGMISKDFTQGYGPEEYLVRRARPGEYAVQANFYGSRSQQLTGPTTVQATVITRFGRPDEARQALTLRLTEEREVVSIGAVKFE